MGVGWRVQTYVPLEARRMDIRSCTVDGFYAIDRFLENPSVLISSLVNACKHYTHTIYEYQWRKPHRGRL
jgi:hypothetical protein